MMYQRITVARLIEMLGELPPDSEVSEISVRNESECLLMGMEASAYEEQRVIDIRIRTPKQSVTKTY